MSTPQHDPTSDTPSPTLPQGATSPGHATSPEAPQPSQVHDASAVPTVLGAAQSSPPTHHVHDAQHPHMHETVIGAAQNVLSRLASSSSPRTPHVHDAQHPHMHEAVLGAAQNVFSRLTSSSNATPAHQHDAQHPHMHETVIGAAQNVLSRLASPSSPHATPAHQHVQDVPRERLAEAPVLTDVPQRTAEPTSQGPAPTSDSSHGGGSGRARPITPPPGVARIARSYPAVPETTHPRPFRGIHSVHRRTTGPYADSETAYHAYDDRDPFREKSVGQRLDPTIKSAKEEHFKASNQATTTGLAQNIAIGLQVLLGALTTALGAALSGKKTSVAVSILGGASTLVASYLARTKGSNEPQTSLLRAQSLDHFLREIEAFDLDHGHEFGDKWDDKIKGFRLGLERILGNHPGSVAINSDTENPGREKWVGGGDANGGPSGNGKYPMATKPGLMV